MTKVSLNKWYAGEHWTKRKRIKDDYKLLVKSKFKHVFHALGQYAVEYTFYFKGKPLDASNCVAMVKLIEDIIFVDDKWDVVTEITIRSIKSKEEKVIIKITEH